MKITILLSVILIFSLIACNGDLTNQDSAKHPDELVGLWKSEMIRITMYSVRNTDDSEIFEANRDNWEDQMGIKPIVTTFDKNGTYYYSYKNLEDSTLKEVKGKWHFENDSLYFDQLVPEKKQAVYHVVVKNDMAKFTSRLDWDEDGKKDDLYFGIQRKIKK